jgi:hypothetical protein
MFCSNCGAMMDLGHNFCSKCGQRAANPLPPEPVAPFAPAAPQPPVRDPDDDGDEAVLFRKGHACYFTGKNTWVTGTIVLTDSYLVFYPVHIIKTFRIFFRDIDAVADAFASLANTRFALRTRDGRYWAFSLNTVDINDTQAVAERIRALSGVSQKFDPYSIIY